MRFWLLTILFFTGLAGYSQFSIDSMPNRVIFTKNHTGVFASTQYNRNFVEPLTGTQQLHAAGGFGAGFGIFHDFNISERLAFRGQLLAGALSIPYRIEDLKTQPADAAFEVTDRSALSPLFELSAGVTYRQPLNNRYYLTPETGITVRPVFSNQSTWSHSSADIAYADLGLATERGTRTGIYSGIGIARIVKKADLLSLSLIYHYSLQDYARGSYILFPGQAKSATGHWGINGNFLEMKIAYAFTGAEQFWNLNYILAGREDKSIRKGDLPYKLDDLRQIPTDSWYVMIHGQIHVTTTRANDPNGLFQSSLGPAPGYGLRFTKEYPTRLLLLGDVEALTFDKWEKFPGNTGISGSPVCRVVAFSLGTGYRWRTANQRPIADITAGIAIGVNQDYREGYSSASGSIKYGQLQLNYVEYTYQVNKAITMAYAGLSRDFRIRDPLYLSLGYRYYLGLAPLAVSNYQYTSNQTTGTTNASLTITGSHHEFLMGLSYRLGNFTKPFRY